MIAGVATSHGEVNVAPVVAGAVIAGLGEIIGIAFVFLNDDAQLHERSHRTASGGADGASREHVDDTGGSTASSADVGRVNEALAGCEGIAGATLHVAIGVRGDVLRVAAADASPEAVCCAEAALTATTFAASSSLRQIDVTIDADGPRHGDQATLRDALAVCGGLSPGASIAVTVDALGAATETHVEGMPAGPIECIEGAVASARFLARHHPETLLVAIPLAAAPEATPMPEAPGGVDASVRALIESRRASLLACNGGAAVAMVAEWSPSRRARSSTRSSEPALELKPAAPQRILPRDDDGPRWIWCSPPDRRSRLLRELVVPMLRAGLAMRTVAVPSLPLAVLLAALSASVGGCTSGGTPTAGLGASCRVDADCTSAMCESAEGRQFCSVECTSAAECAPAVSGASLVCDATAGHCVPRCSDGATRGAGPARELCQAGVYVACSGLDDVAQCAACGCEPFGGGNCLAGMGCVMPSPDGTACTLDGQCASGRCYADTNVCGAARAMGDPCTNDDDCSTHNCSNDGNTATPGHCNQTLGSSCMGASGATATCTRCERPDTFSDGICTRTACAPITHDHCPRTTDRAWRCESSVDGLHHCYETCPTDGSLYHCYDAFEFCSGGLCN